MPWRLLLLLVDPVARLPFDDGATFAVTSVPLQRVTAAASCAGSTGLVRKSSMPAARHRSRSPGIAEAVIAMIGVRRPRSRGRSHFRGARG